MMNYSDRVLQVVSQIPAGQVMTYSEVASRAGSPGAARAVGTLMKNNHDLEIPCHRVVCSDFTVGEYNRGGPDAKIKKLQSEGVIIEKGIIQRLA